MLYYTIILHNTFHVYIWLFGMTTEHLSFRLHFLSLKKRKRDLFTTLSSARRVHYSRCSHRVISRRANDHRRETPCLSGAKHAAEMRFDVVIRRGEKAPGMNETSGLCKSARVAEQQAGQCQGVPLRVAAALFPVVSDAAPIPSAISRVVVRGIHLYLRARR